MPRAFRVAADEQRYNALKTELYLRLANNASPLVVSEILRNLAKLEELAFYEGVRQGMAAAALSMGDVFTPPLQVHFEIYGMSATPLVRAEQQWAKEEQFPADHVWLDDQPIEFGPMTLAEAQADGRLAAAIAPAPASAPAPAPATQQSTDYVESPSAALDLAEALGIDEKQLDEWMNGKEDETKAPAEPPDLLDNIRDHILGRKDWRPENWEDLILNLHRELAMDAGYLDLILSSPMGQTVLSQCGFMHLHPGASIVMGEDGKLTVR